MEKILRPKQAIAQDRGIKIFFTVLFAIISLVILFPFVWLFINSFKDEFGNNEFTKNSWALPETWMFSNYLLIFSEMTANDISIVDMFKNTLILCLIVPTAGQLSTVLAAYAMAKYKFVGQKFLYAIYILPMLISITGTLTSTYLLLEKWHMVDNYWGIIIMSCGGTGFGFLMIYSLFKGVSDAYMESARIDGAGHIRTFFQIMLPHVMGLVGTMWVLGFVGVWNDYTTPRIFLGQDNYTIATGIKQIGDLVTKTAITEELLGNYPAYFAAIIMSLIPVVTIFLAFQKQIMKMSLGGGIK